MSGASGTTSEYGCYDNSPRVLSADASLARHPWLMAGPSVLGINPIQSEITELFLSALDRSPAGGGPGANAEPGTPTGVETGPT